MEFIHSVLAQDETAAAGTIVSYDLPVNPLSHILITLKFIRTTAAEANVPAFSRVLNLMDKIEVLYKGSAIFSMSGPDAVAAGLLVAGFESWGVNYCGVAVEECSFTFLVPLGRTLYSERECFPRSTRGELILQITYEAAFTGMTDVQAQIETVELPQAAPEQYLRMTTLSLTPAVAGEHDVQLPIGNPISELILFGTTFPVGNADAATLGFLQILVDNHRRFYSHTNFETIHNMAGRMRCPPGYWGYHTHWAPIAAAADAIIDSVIACNHLLKQYVHVPFDIFRDGRYALETAGKSDVVLRIGVDVGGEAALRVIPCEIVKAAMGV
jgi:hypothetical protein